MNKLCKRCKREVSNEGELLSSQYGWVCENCAKEMFECGWCYELVDSEELVRWKGGEWMCEACKYEKEKQQTEESLKKYLRRQQL